MPRLERQRYKDFKGELYTVFRVTRRFCPNAWLEVDALEIKSDFAIDTMRLQYEYMHNYRDIDFIWRYKYTCDNVKILGQFSAFNFFSKQ
jgi:hypothetical protein